MWQPTKTEVEGDSVYSKDSPPDMGASVIFRRFFGAEDSTSRHLYLTRLMTIEGKDTGCHSDELAASCMIFAVLCCFDITSGRPVNIDRSDDNVAQDLVDGDVEKIISRGFITVQIVEHVNVGKDNVKVLISVTKRQQYML